MASRTNEDWVMALSEPPGEAQSEALQDLHEFLLRSALVYLSQHRSDLAGWGREAVRDLAEDLAQEALLAIRDSLNTFRGEARFTTWACRFVINRAASELRRRRYHDLSLESLSDAAPAAFQSLQAQKGDAEPENLAEQREYLALLGRIIQEELNDRQRAAIVAVHFQGWSMDEVAAALGISRNALYKLLHDARKRIRARLQVHQLAVGDILAAFRS
jgi:RNA polymerase sigma-70 factor (ECF subfamily)